jgi:hypothetical protein
MWLKWLPWRYLVRHAAQSRGFIDPVAVLTRLYRFAEPAEVAAPVELLRAGMYFHARGLINTRAIQHNLDWIWPYWVERQFNPDDAAFIPRSFSLTHVNLTCRNWTAVGLPDVDLLPIVDPAGLLTPHWDGWSLDAWLLGEDGQTLIPSRCAEIEQRWEMAPSLAVVTRCIQGPLRLTARSCVATEAGKVYCRQTWTASSPVAGWLVVSLRPYNPEGVSFLHRIALAGQRTTWMIDDSSRVSFLAPVERHYLSQYREGDVFLNLLHREEQTAVQCEVGMATAAAAFAVEAGRERSIEVSVPLELVADEPRSPWRRRSRAMYSATTIRSPSTWPEALASSARFEAPDAQMVQLYEAALRTLVLHAPGEVYPGPYTYKRFWVRDTAFIVHALLCANLLERAEKTLPHLLARQTDAGYFLSQEGEWDANGEALWILYRFCQLSGCHTPAAWRDPIGKGARWLTLKRTPSDSGLPHAGLLPPGFSAEHLGSNDYYYWDDFWGIAGLRAAAAMLADLGNAHGQETCLRQADGLFNAVERSLACTEGASTHRGMPASPYRRMDAGAIGSLVAGYPLQLFPAADPRLLDTAAFLRENCFVRGGFFQDIIHSGINAYLTLHVAQVLLRAGDPSWFEMVETTAGLASPTGQWPEAIHPHTGGGCMGDGQHVWAAAEWVMAIRQAFVREERDRVVLASGLPAEWLKAETPLRFGPTPTPWGPVSVAVHRTPQGLEVQWTADWRDAPPLVEIRLQGFTPCCRHGTEAHAVFAGSAIP